MDKLLDEYKEKFGECFPLMLTRGMSEDDIIEIVKSCLKNNKPYEVDEERDY